MTSTQLPVPGLRDVPTADAPQNRKEFTSDQEVRWCPGCGDYAVLAAVQGFLPELVLKRYDRVLIPEMNLGQLGLLIRARYLVDAVGYHQVNGMPLKAAALAHAIADLVAEAEGTEAPLGVWGETVVKESVK